MDQINKDTAELADTTVVPDDARANSEQLMTILQMRGEILERLILQSLLMLYQYELDPHYH